MGKPGLNVRIGEAISNELEQLLDGGISVERATSIQAFSLLVIARELRAQPRQARATSAHRAKVEKVGAGHG